LTAGAVKAALAWEPKTPGLVNLWCGPSSRPKCPVNQAVRFRGMDQPCLNRDQASTSVCHTSAART